MTWDERRLRREAMARLVAEGKSPEDVAGFYRVTSQTVYTACREFEVAYPSKRSGKRRSSIRTLQIIGAIFGSTPVATIAKRHGIDEKYVAVLWRECVAARIPVPDLVGISVKKRRTKPIATL